VNISLFQIDAFTGRQFGGNPAAVCPLDGWISDSLMQDIAGENNLAETAFFVRNGGCFDLRWFTPEMEVDLCGHATLAAAFVIFQYIDTSLEEVEFSTQSGVLRVEKEGDLLAMDFPSRPPVEERIEEELIPALGTAPVTVLKSRDYFAVYETENQIRDLNPDFTLLSRLECLGVIVTARGSETDFVSRFFAPGAGIPEDPVTGSAHCTLIPYWAEVLGKKTLHARQLSSRGGEIFCEDLGGRVKIAGKAVKYLEGEITV